MRRKYHRVCRKALLFVSLVRYITFIYKVKLISTGQKISRKDQKGARKEKERERQGRETEKSFLMNYYVIFIKILKVDLC